MVLALVVFGHEDKEKYLSYVTKNFKRHVKLLLKAKWRRNEKVQFFQQRL